MFLLVILILAIATAPVVAAIVGIVLAVHTLAGLLSHAASTRPTGLTPSARRRAVRARVATVKLG